MKIIFLYLNSVASSHSINLLSISAKIMKNIVSTRCLQSSPLTLCKTNKELPLAVHKHCSREGHQWRLNCSGQVSWCLTLLTSSFSLIQFLYLVPRMPYSPGTISQLLLFRFLCCFLCFSPTSNHCNKPGLGSQTPLLLKLTRLVISSNPMALNIIRMPTTFKFMSQA